MGRITQTYRKTVTKRIKKIPAGYHKCPNCGGDGVCKNKTQRRKKY